MRIEILVQFLKRFNDLVMTAEDWFNETFDPLHDDFDLVNIQNYILSWANDTNDNINYYSYLN